MEKSLIFAFLDVIKISLILFIRWWFFIPFFYIQLAVKNVQNKCLDSNPGRLVTEATTLPTVPQLLPEVVA